jgi:hypothetical protein
MTDEPIPFQPRPDGEQVTRAPYSVALGQTVYQLTPLTIRQSKEWKSRLRDVVGDLLDTASTSTDNLSQVMDQIKGLLVTSDDQMLDLLCAYDARIDGDRERIEDSATSLQAFSALMEIVRVEFPFLRSLNALQA